MRILQNNLLRGYELHASEYEAKALSVLRSGYYVLGPEVRAFEEAFARYLGAEHFVGLASGLDALWIAFRVLGIGSGDEVIVCANAYIACVMGITINGATPVFVEPDEYLNIDADRIEAAITPRTKAILAVHLFGQACDMTRIMALASKHGLRVVEDCAQSHGNRWNGQTVGTFGDVGCFSFYPTKGCGAFGDGGGIATNDASLSDAVRVFRNYGSRIRYENEVVGTNSRLDELQAGLLRVKLTHLDELNAERQALAGRYLAGIDNPAIGLPAVRPDADSVWHQFVIRCEARDALMEYLGRKEIGTLIHYPIPPHLSRAYEYLGYRAGDFPIAEHSARTVLSLPMYNGMTAEEQRYVIDAVNRFKVDRA